MKNEILMYLKTDGVGLFMRSTKEVAEAMSTTSRKVLPILKEMLEEGTIHKAVGGGYYWRLTEKGDKIISRFMKVQEAVIESIQAVENSCENIINSNVHDEDSYEDGYIRGKRAYIRQVKEALGRTSTIGEMQRLNDLAMNDRVKYDSRFAYGDGFNRGVNSIYELIDGILYVYMESI